MFPARFLKFQNYLAIPGTRDIGVGYNCFFFFSNEQKKVFYIIRAKLLHCNRFFIDLLTDYQNVCCFVFEQSIVFHKATIENVYNVFYFKT